MHKVLLLVQGSLDGCGHVGRPQGDRPAQIHQSNQGPNCPALMLSSSVSNSLFSLSEALLSKLNFILFFLLIRLT